MNYMMAEASEASKVRLVQYL